MALDSYANLQASITAWLYNRSTLATVIPDFIALNEATMDGLVKHRLMATSAPITLAGEITTLPADFRGPISLADSTKVLPNVTLEQMAQDRLCVTSKDDQRYAILGSQLQVWPAPTNGDVATLVYMQAIPRLSVSNTSNWLLARWPNAYLFGSLLQAAPYLDHDDRIPTWQGFFQAALADIENSNVAEASRGARVRSGAPTP